MWHWVWYIWVRGGDILCAVVCTWALLRGGKTERAGAVIFLVGWLLTALASRPGMGPGPWVVIIDSVALVAYIALALWSRRLWTYFAAACMVNAVLAHFAHNLTSFGLYGYATIVAAWGGVGLILCLAWGVFSYRRDLRRQAGPG